MLLTKDPRIGLPPIQNSRSISKGNARTLVPSTDGLTRAKQSFAREKEPHESKLPKIAGYLQRERVKRFADVTKKMTWDTIQRMDPAELEGVTNQGDFDPRDILGVQSREDMQFVKQVVGEARTGLIDRTARKPGADRALSVNGPMHKPQVYKWSATPSDNTSELQKTKRLQVRSNSRAT